MSADNYMLIRRHPSGGFAAVMGFASDDQEPTVDPSNDMAYSSIEGAMWSVRDDYTEYGISVHQECWPETAGEFTTYSETPARPFSYHAAMDAHAEAIAPRPPVYPERRTARQP